jgi:hypothetical protein
MKRSRRSDTTSRGASTLGNAQLGEIRGGASMVEYAVLLSNPPTLALVSNPPTLALVSNPPTQALVSNPPTD